MYQDFRVTARPEQGPPRLQALRAEIAAEGLDGFLVPRADAHQGEYVAPRDERLAWLTGFTGSAGFCAVLARTAGVFIDGRYRTQVKAQVADVFTPVPWPEVDLAGWLAEHLPQGGVVGFDPWLHTVEQIDKARAALEGRQIVLRACPNLVDRVWTDQPAPPVAPVAGHALDHAGEEAGSKCARLGKDLAAAGQAAALLSLPDSICWLLNIRGGDIPRTPVAHGFALLGADGTVDLFMASDKLAGVDLPEGVRQHPPEALLPALAAAAGPVRIDPGSAPVALAQALGDRAVAGTDPCALPKACKNAAEIAGAEAAHLRDGAAVVELLAWLDAQPAGSLTETRVVRHLEGLRRRDPMLRDISFETIAGTGANGAIMHYRVTEETDARLEDGDLLVLDSGGQYLDGTTDITRTLAIGTPPQEARAAFTRVLRGMIAMSRLRWPRGLAGRDIEAVARVPLWLAGQDFNHGVGHGVGAFLGVHEGPQRLSRLSHVPLLPGMILSNEPGYYREGAFGIRIENLLVVAPAPALPGADPERDFLAWKTLTLAPIDRRLIVAEDLTRDERAWLDQYHADVAARLAPLLGKAAAEWLIAATAPL